MSISEVERNTNELTDSQFKEARQYAVSLGMDGVIEKVKGYTAYLGGELDMLMIGDDVLSKEERDWRNPNSNISMRGTIAHEIIGHRQAVLEGFAFEPRSPLEEII